MIIKNKSAWNSGGGQDHRSQSGDRITPIGLLKATRSIIKIYFSHLKYSKFSYRNFCSSDERYLFNGTFKVGAMLLDYASSRRLKNNLIDNGLLCL